MRTATGLEPAAAHRVPDASGLADLHGVRRTLPTGHPLRDRLEAGDRLAALGRSLGHGRPWLLLDSAGGLEELAGPSALLMDPLATFAVDPSGHPALQRHAPDSSLLDALAEAGDRATAALSGPVGRDPSQGPLARLLLALHHAMPRHEAAALRDDGPALTSHVGLAGFLAYDALRLHEPVAAPSRRLLSSPELLLTFYGSAVAVDPRTGSLGSASLLSATRASELLDRLLQPSGPRPAVAPPSGQLTHHTDRAAYLAGVERVRHHIREGDVFQANLTLAVSTPAPDAFALYRRLRRLNPSPFSSFMDPGDPALPTIASSSPERLVSARGFDACSRPIAGTRPRGATPAEELALEEELLSSEKEMAEHTMLVDLVRNDMGRVARAGSVRVAEFARVEDYSHVKHLVSNVTGHLARIEDQPALVASFFPGGTVTGAPKVRACQLLADLEPHARGPYTGSLGYFSTTGNMDWNILIRTLVVAGGRAYAQAGAGIVADSEPGAEHRESLQKAEALALAAGGTRLG